MKPSLAKFKPNPNWAKLPLFNHKNWSRLRFGDIVENVNERVETGTAKRWRKSQMRIAWLGRGFRLRRTDFEAIANKN